MNCVHCNLPLRPAVAKRRDSHVSCGRVARTGKPVIKHDGDCSVCGKRSECVQGLDFQIRCGPCLADRPSVERELYAARVADINAFWAAEDRKEAKAAREADIL